MGYVFGDWRKSVRSGPFSDNCVEIAPVWRKSSLSSATNGCVEVGTMNVVSTGAASTSVWQKSSASAGNGACVEVSQITVESFVGSTWDSVGAKSDAAIAVRDSKDPSGPVLLFTRGEWEAFIGGVKDGEFDTDAVK